jgi:hypothetical protein
MAVISLNKEDLSVDNVHTPFDLTKQRLHWPTHPRNELEPGCSRQDLEVMLRSVPLPMKRCRRTTTYRTHQERNA